MLSLSWGIILQYHSQCRWCYRCDYSDPNLGRWIIFLKTFKVGGSWVDPKDKHIKHEGLVSIRAPLDVINALLDLYSWWSTSQEFHSSPTRNVRKKRHAGWRPTTPSSARDVLMFWSLLKEYLEMHLSFHTQFGSSRWFKALKMHLIHFQWMLHLSFCILLLKLRASYPARGRKFSFFIGRTTRNWHPWLRLRRFHQHH